MPLFVFDAYGTLFDVHAAIRRYSTGSEADRMSEIWRAKQLEYTWTLTLAGHYADFWTLTERALDFALARVPSVDKALKPKLLEAYFKLNAFPDARAALGRLKQRGHKTAILSNGSAAMLTGAVDAAGIGSNLDAALRFFQIYRWVALAVLCAVGAVFLYRYHERKKDVHNHLALKLIIGAAIVVTAAAILVHYAGRLISAITGA